MAQPTSWEEFHTFVVKKWGKRDEGAQPNKSVGEIQQRLTALTSGKYMPRPRKMILAVEILAFLATLFAWKKAPLREDAPGRPGCSCGGHGRPPHVQTLHRHWHGRRQHYLSDVRRQPHACVQWVHRHLPQVLVSLVTTVGSGKCPNPGKCPKSASPPPHLPLSSLQSPPSLNHQICPPYFHYTSFTYHSQC